MNPDELFPDFSRRTPDTATRKIKSQPSKDFAMFASVAVLAPFMSPFTYGIPESMAKQMRVGSIVEVPFGKQILGGCVMALSERPPEDLPANKIRSIKALRTPEFYLETRELELAQWIAERTMAPIGETISCVSFIGFSDISIRTVERYALTTDYQTKLASGKSPGTKMKIVIETLAANPNAPMSAAEIETQTKLGSVHDALKRLLNRQIITRDTDIVERMDDYAQAPKGDKPLPLTEEQQIATTQINASIDHNTPDVYLLHGVTGSGKTEVYLNAIRHTLDLGGDAICLVPEISLTPQAVDRFRRRFGDMVGVYHSRLSIGQKFDLWRRVISGHCRVMIGARSALFTPFQNLRLIILDEEHENSYKQNNAPRYHCREVAIEIAKRRSLPVVLGSATPNVESYYQTQNGNWKLLTLSNRVDSQPLPTVHIIDMSRELLEHPKSELLSQDLINALKHAKEAGEMSILFINRRGFFSIIRCSNCGAILRCDNCEVPLTYHKTGNTLRCHYCEQQYAPVTDCPHCLEKEGLKGTLIALGIGTQRLEETVQKLFPDANIRRMDYDTTRTKNAYIEAWNEISHGQTDILIGTQMIARGLHIENVTVVGVPLADISLYQPDFRSTERTFCLLTQVAGRAGRGDKPGHVYIQTYAPFNYAIRFAQKHDYNGFYQKEIRLRKILRFPPFSTLAAILATGREEEAVATMAKEFASILNARLWEMPKSDIVVLGPNPAPIAKIENSFRWRILVRGTDDEKIREVLKFAMNEYAQTTGHQNVQITVDINPTELM
ncbi:MAG: primosomal protein N' [Candidatus Sumerlaeales bacterium]|nr:primosomal protein N' [Candidatus Sumerlaeales bacterium]